MFELEASLKTRLHEHEEQLKRHRQLVEKQREWLVDRSIVTPMPVSEIGVPCPAPSVPKKTPIEDRLLKKGEDARRRIEVERERAEKERLENETNALKTAVPSASSAVPRNRHGADSVRSFRNPTPVESTSSPQISLMSEKLADNRRAKEGLSQVDIADSLLIRAARAKESSWLREISSQQQVEGKPTVTAKASHLQRQGSTFERLYASHAKKHAEPHDDLRCLIDDTLASGTPVITPRAQGLQRRHGHSVCDDLYDDAKRSRELRVIRAATPPARCVPKIDVVSELIASQLPTTSVQRLTQPRHRVVGDKAPTFKPTITKCSERLASRRENDRPRFEDLHHDSFRRAAVTTERTLMKRKTELESCTFSPVISSKAAKHSNEADTVTRMTKWKQRRDQRLEDERVKHLEEEAMKCTFTPVTNVKVPQEPQEDVIYGGDGHAWGFHDFVDRQNAARRKRSEEDERVAQVFSDGSHWTRNSTVPQNPNISCYSTPEAKTNRAQNALQLAMHALREAEAVSALS